VSSAGVPSTTYDSNEPAISAEGRYVAFTTDEPFDPIDKIAASQSSTDGHADESGPDADVYVRDTQTGHTMLISYSTTSDVDGGEHPANGSSGQPSISGTGQYIAFRTSATNISGSTSAIVLCDRGPEIADTCAFTVISAGEGDVSNPHLSADGRRVSYDVTPIRISIVRAAVAIPTRAGSRSSSCTPARPAWWPSRATPTVRT